MEDDEDEAEGAGNEKAIAKPSAVNNVSTKAVPAAVFGGLSTDVEKIEGGDSSKKGALDRLRAAAGK